MTIRRILERLFKQENVAACDLDVLASVYEAIASDVAIARRHCEKPIVLGICGCQGSGKSTMALVLQALLQEVHGLSVAVISIDDLYLSRRQRRELAQTVHPLLETRGVPGTHDVDLGLAVIRSLVSAGPETVTRIPRFNKTSDEPLATDSWDKLRGKVDIVIFEGWCVGALPERQDALALPTNALERDRDSDGRWRG